MMAAGMKGFIDGVYQGLYKNPNYTVSDKCMNVDFMQNI